ncbi:hypothetical protein BDZ89DRAFT_1151584 [Hymenopellis radicata]|nr:hypothetical protein BDZ89DRAFT_1151584 [Hymenopellis radicata]
MATAHVMHRDELFLGHRSHGAPPDNVAYSRLAAAPPCPVCIYPAASDAPRNDLLPLPAQPPQPSVTTDMKSPSFLPEGGLMKWAQNKAADTWAGFGKSKDGSWQLKLFQYGERLN